ncbi:Bug family tripartite tricarboxylate transporter substrate binding protein [Humitalea sp. 24SJ18S-53]|uniref:Bug family tripartite tricarboxylate transporter substrate binding protein n=1 Tax=Humitalea sp. 24SJ18S-53 TaxID=3422307 RepID=UPI003D67AF19
MLIDRRALLGAVLLAPAARAQTPAAPLRMVIPWAPGGSTDVVGRFFAEVWQQRLGQTVVIENRSGASGTIGHAFVANAPADGRTVLLATNSTYAIAPALYNNIPYVHDNAFAPVTLLARSPLVLCVNTRLDARDIAGLIALARARPTALNMGIGGTGATSHLASELFMAHSGTQFTLVAYRGSGQTMQALNTGEIDAAFLSATTVRPLVEAGTVRVLGTTGTTRSLTLPQVPPIAESGLPQFEATTAYALFVPKATPPAEIARLHTAAAAALTQPQLREKLAVEDIEVIGGGPDVLAAHVREETVKWAEIIRSRNISAS